MLRNNIQLALRHLAKNRTFAAINIFGLAIGVAASLLLFHMVKYEHSFNTGFANSERIGRIVTTEVDPSGGKEQSAGIPIPAMTVMASTVPQFELFSRVREAWPTLAVPDANGNVSQKKFAVKSDGTELAFFAESNFLKIFNWEWLGGDASTALEEVNSVVLTKSWAEKCFGTWQEALNKRVVMDNTVQLVVRGVVADPPQNCDFPFAFLVSYPTVEANKRLYYFSSDWGSISSNDQGFALLKTKDSWDAANAVLSNIGAEEYKKENGRARNKTHRMQPLSDLHFNEDLHSSGSHFITRGRLWILTSIGLLILLMACFNFINLATAQATMRAREVGVRKSLGSSRGQLVGQFMTETSLVVVSAVAIGTALAGFSSHFLKYISDVPADWPFLSQPAIWAYLAIAALVMIFLSGFYPSMVLSGFDPIKAFRNNAGQQSVGGIPIRKVLVVGQFIIAQALIVGTLVTLNQLDFLRNLDLGFKKDLIYTFNFQSDSLTQSKLDVLKQRMLALPSVETVSFSSDMPSSGNTWNSNFALGRGKEDAPFNVSIKYTDVDYIKNYGIEMAAGRWLEASDTIREAVVNEVLLERLGVKPEDALGQELKLGGGRRNPLVVGVVKDFHSHSLHEPLEPLMMTTRKIFYSAAGVKIRPENMTATTAAIQKIFDETYPEQVFEGEFFDESIANFYTSESRFSYTCRSFAGLAILISCLGLFGLATHAASRRTKEIGVRKVLGASVANITGLLSKDFLKLVLVAILIASPLAWYFMQQWLADFAYRIELHWWVFMLAGAVAIIIAFITVSFQSVKAALANPVKSLRSE